ncbi:hypothetical protein BJY52DRAFT_1228459 [Lactarius psammicola]|nr:hypothetical protein BJY52DRAFT_1228459 [Lactarius psammicola]
MQWRVSSSLAAITSLILLFAGDLVVAQISAPICTDLTSSWGWFTIDAQSFNSLDQNPCKVLAYMMSTCYGGGPSRLEVREADSCWCNTVTFSLASACGECQGGQSLFLSTYYENCTRILEPSTFPNRVPAGTRVPQWALVDVTLLGYWSVSTALLVGGKQLNLLPTVLV